MQRKECKRVQGQYALWLRELELNQYLKPQKLVCCRYTIPRYITLENAHTTERMLGVLMKLEVSLVCAFSNAMVFYLGERLNVHPNKTGRRTGEDILNRRGELFSTIVDYVEQLILIC